MIVALAAAVLMALTGGATAQSVPTTPPPPPAAIPAAPPPPPIGKASNPRLIEQTELPYPDASRLAGHQGTVRITATIRADGSVAEAVLATSSGASELDAIALAEFPKWRYAPGTEADGRPVAMPLTVAVTFAKDSLVDLPKKSCADFTTDLRWYEATFPGQPRKEMRLYRLMSGAFFLAGMDRSRLDATRLRASIAKFATAFDATVTTCAAKPDATFVDVIKRAMR